MTLKHIQQACHSLLRGQLLQDTLQKIENSISQMNQLEKNVLFDESLAHACNLSCSPQLLLFLLQSVPEFSACDALTMTLEALLAISALVDSLSTTLIVWCGEISKEKVKEFPELQPLISPAHITMAVKGKLELTSLFGSGIIRMTDWGVNDTEVIENPALGESKEQMQAYETFEELFDEPQNPYVYPFNPFFAQDFFLYTLDVLVEFPAVVYDLDTTLSQAEDDAALVSNMPPPYSANIFERQIQALNGLPKKMRESMNKFVKHLEVQYEIRDNDRYRAQTFQLPVFDMESIHMLCVYACQEIYKQRGIVDVKVHMSMEACDLINCLLEHFVILLMRKVLRIHYSTRSTLTIFAKHVFNAFRLIYRRSF
jgi:hypothetical protein